MSLFIKHKQRVVKGYTVNLTKPLLLDPASETFEHLYNKIPKVIKSKQQDTVSTLQEEQAPDKQADTTPDPSQDLEKSKQAAQEILSAAEKQADEILKTAQEQAAELKRRAEEEIDNWKKEVAEEVRQETLLTAKAEAETILQQAEKLFELAQKTLHNEYQQADEKLLKLAVSIAERIIKASLAIKPQMLLNTINSLLLLPQEKDELCLQISPQDAAWITGLGYESFIPCQWVINESLSQGDICLDHKRGVYDARLQSQLRKLEQILREELARGKMGQA